MLMFISNINYKKSTLDELETSILNKTTLDKELLIKLNEDKENKLDISSKYFTKAYLAKENEKSIDVVKKYLELAKDNINGQTDEVTKVHVYKLLSDIMVDEGNTEKAIEYSQMAFLNIDTSQYNDRYKLIPYIFNPITQVEDGIDLIIDNVKDVLGYKNIKDDVRIYLNRYLSGLYIMDSNYPESIATHLEVIKLTKITEDYYYKNKSIIDIAVLSRNLGGYELAKNILNDVNIEEIEDKTKRIDVGIYKNINLAQINIHLNEYDEARKALNNIDKYINEIGNNKKRSIECVRNLTMAELLVKENNTDEAGIYINKAEDSLEEGKNTYVDIDIYFDLVLGELYQKQGYDHKALDMIDEAMKGLEKISNFEYYKNCLTTYIEIYLKIEDKDNLLKYSNLYSEYQKTANELSAKNQYDYIWYKVNYNKSQINKEKMISFGSILILLVIILLMILIRYLFHPYYIKIIEKNKVKKYLKNNNYLLNYQAIINPKKNEIVGFEGLLRLKIKEKIIYPNQIISQIEKTNMMGEVSLWILNQIINDYGEIKNKFNMDNKFYISMNISLKEIEDDNICNSLIEKLKSSNIKKDCICIEITENESGKNEQKIIKNIRNLHNAGFKIAIDDFGVDYSNLSVIDKLEFSIIKLDKYFIDNIENSIAIQSLIDAVRYIAIKKDISVVVEGVEDFNQKEFVKNISSDKFYIQGYYYSKPMELSKIKDIQIK